MQKSSPLFIQETHLGLNLKPSEHRIRVVQVVLATRLGRSLAWQWELHSFTFDMMSMVPRMPHPRFVTYNLRYDVHS